MTLDEILEELRDARARGLPWTRVVELMEKAEALPEFRERFPSRARFKEKAAELAGYSSNVVHRMGVASSFLHSIIDSHAAKGPLVADFFSGSGAAIPSFFKVELAKRAYDVDPDRGLDLLEKVLTTNIKDRELREAYDAVVTSPPFFTPAKTTHRTTAAWSKQAFKAVSRHVQELTGSTAAHLYFRRYRFPFVDVDAVAVGSKDHGVEFVDGIDFMKKADIAQPSALQRFLAQTEFKASFFRRYWIATSAEEEQQQLIADYLKQLRLLSVGVVAVADKTGVRIIREPEQLPTPDRQADAKAEVFRQGVPAP